MSRLSPTPALMPPRDFNPFADKVKSRDSPASSFPAVLLAPAALTVPVTSSIAPAGPPGGAATASVSPTTVAPTPAVAAPVVRSAVDTLLSTYDELMATASWSPEIICTVLERVVERMTRTYLDGAGGAARFLRHEIFQCGNRQPRILLGTPARLQELLHEDTATLCLGERNLMAAIALYNAPAGFQRKPAIQLSDTNVYYLVIGVGGGGDNQALESRASVKRRVGDGEKEGMCAPVASKRARRDGGDSDAGCV